MELLDSLGRALGRKQMQVSMAVSGEQAWTQIENEAPDVVILDLRLPQDEGLSWLRRLKSCHPRIEVIIMTGHPSYGVAHEAMRLGAFDFVIKPLDPARLAELIRAAFSHSQQAVKQRWRTEAEATLKRDPD
jgi:two-component system response regulator CpxR